ncbi:MAG: helix-turn-helix transcriptional regulator [Oscillospiraceae bacterium]
MLERDYDLEQTNIGKKPNQKLKAYLIMKYLLEHADDAHAVSATELKEYLISTCGIYADRRSIYRDIEDINKVLFMMQQNIGLSENDEDRTDIQAAEEMLQEDENLKPIKYDKSKKGFVVVQGLYEPNDIRLLSECIYSAKFLDESTSQQLVDIVCGLLSKPQAEKIKNEVLLSKRVRTQNKSVYATVSTINKAMSKEDHIPEKISFKYLYYDISDLSHQKERRNGEPYVVDPYRLFIENNNYYLIAFDEKKKLRTYRIDRMKRVKATGVPRECEKESKNIELNKYLTENFDMFSGNEERVSIRFIPPLLDTVVDKFGVNQNTVYINDKDKKHFTVTTKVIVSNRFYAWLAGFGSKAKIISPSWVVEGFKEYINKIQVIYEEDEK